MKTSYYVIIAIVIIIIIAIVVRNNKRKAEADANVAQIQQQVINGDSSTTASILNSLFPYFQLGANTYNQNKPK